MIGTISLATSLFFSLLAVMAYGYAMKVKAEQERAKGASAEGAAAAQPSWREGSVE